MVMQVRVKVKSRGGRGPFRPGKKWAEMNQQVAATFANGTLEIMRALTPVDTGLTRDTTVIVHGKPKVPRLELIVELVLLGLIQRLFRHLDQIKILEGLVSWIGIIRLLYNL